LRGRDALDPRLHAPGAHFELELPELDLELLAALLLFFEDDEQLARLMLRGDGAEGAGDDHGEEHAIEPHHYAISARGRPARSAVPATPCGLPLLIRAPPRARWRCGRADWRPPRVPTGR